MEFRLADKNDFPMLAAMRYAFCNEMGDGDEAVIEAKFASHFITFLQQGIEGKAWYYFIAEEAKQAIGHMFIKKVSMPPRPNGAYGAFGYLTNVYIKPPFRNRQVGTEMMQHVIDWAKKEHMELLIVWPSEESAHFYERFGFALNEVRELRF